MHHELYKFTTQKGKVIGIENGIESTNVFA